MQQGRQYFSHPLLSLIAHISLCDTQPAAKPRGIHMLGTFFDVPFLIHLNPNNLTGQADLTGFAPSWQSRTEELIPL